MHAWPCPAAKHPRSCRPHAFQASVGSDLHMNSPVAVLQGAVIASTDADGVAKLWDVRMVAELLTIDSGEHPANKCSFDRSGEVVAVASENSKVMCYSASAGTELMQLHGHDDAVQAVLFDQVNGEFMVTAASDCTFRLWS